MKTWLFKIALQFKIPIYHNVKHTVQQRVIHKPVLTSEKKERLDNRFAFKIYSQRADSIGPRVFLGKNCCYLLRYFRVYSVNH